MGAVNIIKFKSEDKRTFFAPEYDYTIFETQAFEIDFKELAKLILSKEKELLSLPISTTSGDAYTGLKKDSTTTRFDKYNVLKWEGENIKHIKELKKQNIPNIDLVIVDLYPFEKQLKEKIKFQRLIKYIDVGGFTLIRSAAKNFNAVTIISDIIDYSLLIKELKINEGATSIKFRKRRKNANR